MEILGAAEISRIERRFASGLPARTILEIFRPKGVRLSEATFRKYVQAGLLPRSRRVGEKGMHRGSHGVYPVESVRRINAIKKMMASGLTLDDIKRSFVSFESQLGPVEQSLGEVFGRLDSELGQSPLPAPKRQAMRRQLRTLRQRARALVSEMSRVGSALTERPKAGKLSTGRRARRGVWD